jgi:hypothetical protein
MEDKPSAAIDHAAIDAYYERIANFVPQGLRKPARKDKPLDKVRPIVEGQKYITRDQVRVRLGGMSLATVARREREGILKGVQFQKKQTTSSEYHSTSTKYYLLTDVDALAEKMKREAASKKRRKAD